MHLSGAYKDQKRRLTPMELPLQTIVNYHVGAEN